MCQYGPPLLHFALLLLHGVNDICAMQLHSQRETEGRVSSMWCSIRTFGVVGSHVCWYEVVALVSLRLVSSKARTCTQADAVGGGHQQAIGSFQGQQYTRSIFQPHTFQLAVSSSTNMLATAGFSSLNDDGERQQGGKYLVMDECQSQSSCSNF